MNSADDEPLWQAMDSRPRISMRDLEASDLPEAPGVYALYRINERWYVGKATSLRSRVSGNHSGRGRNLGSSAMRRNIAEHLGFGTPARIKDGTRRLSQDELAAVRGWLDECDIAWVETTTVAAAVDLEAAMKTEARPRLTKR